jgi:hypothetical protein
VVGVVREIGALGATLGKPDRPAARDARAVRTELVRSADTAASAAVVLVFSRIDAGTVTAQRIDALAAALAVHTALTCCAGAAAAAAVLRIRCEVGAAFIAPGAAVAAASDAASLLADRTGRTNVPALAAVVRIDAQIDAALRAQFAVTQAAQHAAAALAELVGVANIVAAAAVERVHIQVRATLAALLGFAQTCDAPP